MPLSEEQPVEVIGTLAPRGSALAVAVHLTAFLALLNFPFLNLAVAALIWLAFDLMESEILQHAREAVAFQATLCIPFFLLLKWLGLMLIRPDSGLISSLTVIFYLALLGLSIMGAFAALKNRDSFRYPLSVLRVDWPRVVRELDELGKKVGKHVFNAGNSVFDNNEYSHEDISAEYIETPHPPYKGGSIVENRYPALLVISRILKFAAIILFIAAVIVAVIGIEILASPMEGIGWAVIGIAVLVASWGILVLAGSEIIIVVMDIERNTRLTAMKIVSRTATASPAPSLTARCSNCEKSYSTEVKGQYCDSCGGQII